MKKVLIVFGTRPEAIKMAPVVKELSKSLDVSVCVTAQHREMLDQVLNLFEIEPDYDLDVMRKKQDLFDLTSDVLLKIKEVLRVAQPDIILVHGDTTTSMATAIAAFYLRIPIGHVEAGLRTYDIYSPFPEEFNRQVTARLSQFNFAPTAHSRENLLKEQIPDDKIYITGNTIIDALYSIINQARDSNFPPELLRDLPFLDASSKEKIVLVTGHRRESFGEAFEAICNALLEIAKAHENIRIVYPVHLNPNVLEPVNRILSDIQNIFLIKPLDYLSFIKLMDCSHLILTDSGGIQEEAPSLGKPVLVMRNKTERPEGVGAGTVKLVGTNSERIFKLTNKILSDDDLYNKMSLSQNPYGDGLASKRIRKVIEETDL